MGGEVDAWRARFGRAAEDHVAERLQEHGDRLIARRYRVRGGEIDLVGLDGRTLVFVEVRARRTGGIDPGETVDRRKQARLRVAAAAFLRSWPGRRPPTRYDVVAVTSSRSGRLRSRWTRDAFRG